MLPSHQWYGIIPGWLLFYGLIAAAGVLFGRRAFYLLRLLLKGKPMPRWDHIPARVGRVIVYVFGQARLLANDFWPGLMHSIIFWGFVVLTLGTIEFFGRGVSESLFLPLLSDTPPYLILQDLFSTLVIVAVGSAPSPTTTGSSRGAPSPRRSPASPRPRSRWSSTWPGGRTRLCSWASWCCCPIPSTCTSWSRRSTSSSRRSSRRASTAAWISRTRRPSGPAI